MRKTCSFSQYFIVYAAKVKHLFHSHKHFDIFLLQNVSICRYLPIYRTEGHSPKQHSER